MNSPKFSVLKCVTLLSLTISCALYLGIISLSYPYFTFRPHKLTSAKKATDELEIALSEASIGNKTLIITIVNKAYAVEQSADSERSMLDLFIESFWVGEGTRELLNNVLIVAVDQVAYERCRFRRLRCYRLVTEAGVDFTGEKLYMSDDFITMMWRRTLFLRDVLKHGYNFIFTDTDVMWLRNPFLSLSNNETVDLQISTDTFNHNSTSVKNSINTGFYFVRSNNKTISLFDTWYSMKDNATGKKEQDVLIDLMHHGIFKNLSINVRFLDTHYFSGFCQDSKDFQVVTTVHANCCRSISAKLLDLAVVLRDWKRVRTFKRDGTNETVTYVWSKHKGCSRSWRIGKGTDDKSIKMMPMSNSTCNSSTGG